MTTIHHPAAHRASTGSVTSSDEVVGYRRAAHASFVRIAPQSAPAAAVSCRAIAVPLRCDGHKWLVRSRCEPRSHGHQRFCVAATPGQCDRAEQGDMLHSAAVARSVRDSLRTTPGVPSSGSSGQCSSSARWPCLASL